MPYTVRDQGCLSPGGVGDVNPVLWSGPVRAETFIYGFTAVKRTALE